MNDITIGQKVEVFSAPMTGEQSFNLADFAGKNVLLYFYPRDNTPGCTQEGKDFRDHYAQLQEKQVEIFGISRDSIKVHEGFKSKHEFPFELISDKEEHLCNLFDVIKEKKMYGKTHMGIERSTFLIDKQGVLVAEWRKVKVKEHIGQVLEAINKLL